MGPETPEYTHDNAKKWCVNFFHKLLLMAFENKPRNYHSLIKRFAMDCRVSYRMYAKHTTAGRFRNVIKFAKIKRGTLQLTELLKTQRNHTWSKFERGKK